MYFPVIYVSTLAAGGIGITPIISILQDVIHKQAAGSEGTLFKKIIVVWTVRDIELAQHVYETILVPLLNKVNNHELDVLVAKNDNKTPSEGDEIKKTFIHSILVGGPNATLEFVLHMSQCKTEDALSTMCPTLPNTAKTTNGWRCGRLDIKKLINDAAAVARGLNVTQVGVVTCGPMEYVRDVRASVEEYRQPLRLLTGHVYFDYHEELFML